jgi:hypothetical protein
MQIFRTSPWMPPQLRDGVSADRRQLPESRSAATLPIAPLHPSGFSLRISFGLRTSDCLYALRRNRRGFTRD